MAKISNFTINVEYMPHDEYRLEATFRGRTYVIGHYRSKVVAHRMANNLHNLLTHLQTDTITTIAKHYGDDNPEFQSETTYSGNDISAFYSNVLDK